MRMENLDIDQLKKDLDEILELSSQQANEVVQTVRNEDRFEGNNRPRTAATADPENMQHYLQVHSLNNEESRNSQNSQHEEGRRRTTGSVTFNDEPEIHIRSQTTVQSATVGVIDARPEMNELGGVNEFTQTGVSLLYAAVESPKELALRNRSSLSYSEQSGIMQDEHATSYAERESSYPVATTAQHHCQHDQCRDYPEQRYQPVYEGESSLLDDIVSLQFQHIPQDPVAFSMLPEDEFIKPASGLPAEKLFFGSQNETSTNDNSIGFPDSAEPYAPEERSHPYENCGYAPVENQCQYAAYYQERMSACRYTYPNFCQVGNKMACQQQQQQRKDFTSPVTDEKPDLDQVSNVEPQVEMDECKRSVTELRQVKAEVEIRPSRSHDQRNLSIISTSSGTTFHKNLDDASFVHEPDTEALGESMSDPGAGNVDFDHYPPLDQRSPIRINIGSKVFVGDEIKEVPEVQPGITVGTISPEFHTRKPAAKTVAEDSPDVVEEKPKTSLEDMVALTEALTQQQDELSESNDGGAMSENKLQPDPPAPSAAPSNNENTPTCVPYTGYDGPVASNMQGRKCTCTGVDSECENPSKVQNTQTASTRRNFGSTSSYRDQDNIVTVRVDGVTTFFQDEEPLPITPNGSSLDLSKKTSKSLLRRSATKLPPNVAFDEPMEFLLSNAILMRDQENINLMTNAGFYVTHSMLHHKPSISEVNQKIFEAPPQQCQNPCKLAIPTLIKSRDANFEFIEQADALTYHHHASSDPALQDDPQTVHESFNSLNNTYDANRLTLKRGMAMENVSELNPNANLYGAPARRNCQCEKRLQAAMEPDPQQMNFKFASVPSGVSVLKFIDKKLMESPVGHPYGLGPETLRGQYGRNDEEQEVYQDDYYWNQQGQQQNYPMDPNQRFPCSTSMTAMCSFTRIPQSDEASSYYQPAGAGQSRSAVEDDDGYMNLPPQGVSHVASSAWVDENEMFCVAQQPSLHYRTPLGLGYRDVMQRPQQTVDPYETEDFVEPRGISKPESPFRKCKCAFKRLSKIFRKD